MYSAYLVEKSLVKEQRLDLCIIVLTAQQPSRIRSSQGFGLGGASRTVCAINLMISLDSLSAFVERQDLRMNQMLCMYLDIQQQGNAFQAR
jgi:hypothetical protein